MRKIFLSTITIACLLIVWTVISLGSPVMAQGADVNFEIGNIAGKPGETINVAVSVSSISEINSIALYNLTFDSNILTFEGFDNYNDIESKCLFSGGFDEEKQVIALALKSSEKLSEYICTLKFSINKNAEDGDVVITMTSLVKNNSTEIASTVSNGIVTVKSESAVHIHDMKFYDEQRPTCHTTGNAEYWRCLSCNKNFRDQYGTKELTEVTLAVDDNNHEGGTILRNAVDATAYKEGYSGDIYCLGCGSKLKTGYKLSVLDDTFDDTEKEQEPEEENQPSPSVADEQWMNPFKDIQKTDSFYNAIRFVYENGLFKGVSTTEFAPETTMTRAMFVTVLGRLAGVDTMYFYGSSFEDVILGEWYAPYVEWASEYGIVNGYGDGRFGVNDRITIEQAVVIMARYAEYIGLSTWSDVTLNQYQDSGTISAWATEPMKWAVENEIYFGVDFSLNPQLPAKRSLVAEIIYSFVNEFGE